MTQEFIDVIINEIINAANEKNIDAESVKNFLIDTIKKTYTKKYDAKNLNLEIDLEKRTFVSEIEFEVVPKDDNDYDDFIQIPENDEKLKGLNLKVGDKYYKEFDIPKAFSRSEVLQILQTFKQKMIEVVNQHVYNAWQTKVNQIVFAEFEKEDRKSGAYYINLNDIDGLVATTGYLPKKEQNSRERLINGNKYPFVVKEVIEQSKFWPVVLSRASEELVKYYLQLEIPEIEQDLITITKIARIAGFKTKVLVKSNSKSITEPVAICIGSRGQRIKTISNLIGQEKIEIFEDHGDQIQNLISLFGRAKVLGLDLEYDETNTRIISSIVFVNEDDVSAILGKSGINVKLISKLLNLSIDVKTLDYAHENEIDYIPINKIPELKKHEFNAGRINNAANEMNSHNEIDDVEYSSINMDELINIDDGNQVDDEEFVNDLFNDEISKFINGNEE